MFPTINRILPLIRQKTAPVSIEMHLRRAAGDSPLENTPITFHSYLISEGSLDGALGKAWNTIKHVLIPLEKSLKDCLESFTLLISIATLLDGKSYGINNIKAVIKAVSKVKDPFNNLLKANDLKQHYLGNYFTKYKVEKPCRK